MNNHVEKIKSLLETLSPICQNERKRLEQEIKEGKRFNIFNTLKLSNYETRLHSPLLASLLNPKGDHGLGGRILKLFLAKIGLPEDYISFCNEPILERYIGRIAGTTGGIIDIIIEDGEHAVIIENKIYARDQENQLPRYHNYGINKFGENNFKLVYLRLFDDQEPSDKYINLNYAIDILDILQETILMQPPMPVCYAIKDYIAVVKQLTNNNMDKKHKEKIISIATAEDNFDATIDLLLLYPDIGEYLVDTYIVEPLKKDHRFIQVKTENGALVRELDETYTIVIKTDANTWQKVWISIMRKDKSNESQKEKLCSFNEGPDGDNPFGYSWILDNNGNNWECASEYRVVRNGDVLKWILEKVAAIEVEYKEYNEKNKEEKLSQ